MIKIENVGVHNIEGAIRGMRNPLNSWDKSDSFVDICGEFNVGEADLRLASKLFAGGPPHRKFMRQIFISADITAPLYWWKEADQYKVGTVTDSCSTMHTVHIEPFTINDFSHEHLHDLSIREYNRFSIWWSDTVELLNYARKMYLETKNKVWWWQMIQMAPASYNQMRTITMDYEVAASMIYWRKDHKLDEWRELAKRLLELPYMREITGYGD